MDSILQSDAIDKLPVAELSATLDLFLGPILMHLPERRLRDVGRMAVQGIVAARSPVLSEAARGVSHTEETVWPTVKRLYRFVWNQRFSHLVATVPLPLKLQVAFTHARKVRTVEMGLGWFKIRRLDTQQVLWVLVAHKMGSDNDLVLITNVPIQTTLDAETVYTQWRHRPQIEHTYRFDQKDGLDVKDMRVRTLERMRRVFVLVLLAALFVYHIGHTWPHMGNHQESNLIESLNLDNSLLL